MIDASNSIQFNPIQSNEAFCRTGSTQPFLAFLYFQCLNSLYSALPDTPPTNPYGCFPIFLLSSLRDSRQDIKGTRAVSDRSAHDNVRARTHEWLLHILHSSRRHKVGGRFETHL